MIVVRYKEVSLINRTFMAVEHFCCIFLLAFVLPSLLFPLSVFFLATNLLLFVLLIAQVKNENKKLLLLHICRDKCDLTQS